MNNVFVQRHEGEIVGVYLNRQPQDDGFDLTDPAPLAADHPDVMAFRARTAPSEV